MKAKQKRALEKISGCSWDSWNTEAVMSYFAYTDRGVITPLLERVWKIQLSDNKFNKVEQNLWDLMQYHQFHPVSVEWWKEDFRNGLLFLSDFEGYPESYKEHASEIHDSVML